MINAFDLVQMKRAQLQQTMNKETFRAYGKYWEDFAVMMDDECIENIEDLSVAHVVKFLKRTCGTKVATFKQGKAAVQRMLSELIEDGANIPAYPNILASRSLKIKKAVSKPKLFLSKEELRKCRKNIPELFCDDSSLAKRNLLIWTLFEQTLIREDELIQIRFTDIDTKKKVLAVRGKGALSSVGGKRAVSAYIPLKATTVSMIVEYVSDIRNKLTSETARPYLEYPTTFTSDTPLFTTVKGALSAQMAYKIIAGIIGDTLGYTDDVSRGPHCIRRSVANNLYHDCKDILTVSKVLRHESVETTLKYLGVSQADVNSIYASMGD